MADKKDTNCDLCYNYSRYGVVWGICLLDEEPRKLTDKCDKFTNVKTKK